jgi:hypothetical protein
MMLGNKKHKGAVAASGMMFIKMLIKISPLIHY